MMRCQVLILALFTLLVDEWKLATNLQICMWELETLKEKFKNDTGGDRQ